MRVDNVGRGYTSIWKESWTCESAAICRATRSRPWSRQGIHRFDYKGRLAKPLTDPIDSKNKACLLEGCVSRYPVSRLSVVQGPSYRYREPTGRSLAVLVRRSHRTSGVVAGTGSSPGLTQGNPGFGTLSRRSAKRGRSRCRYPTRSRRRILIGCDWLLKRVDKHPSKYRGSNTRRAAARTVSLVLSGNIARHPRLWSQKNREDKTEEQRDGTGGA